jgi:hypothetical protein
MQGQGGAGRATLDLGRAVGGPIVYVSSSRSTSTDGNSGPTASTRCVMAAMPSS